MLEFIERQNDLVVSVGYVLFMSILILGSAFLGSRIGYKKAKRNHH